MKNVTFLIGNGFDIKIGLKTHYTDFYEVYTQENENDNDIIRSFKKDILSDKKNKWENWADFEIGMGKQSKAFKGENQVEDFLNCINDFVISFNKYLISECEKINWDAVDRTLLNNFIFSVKQFYTYIGSVSTNNIYNLIRHPQGEESRVNFIQFNYTNAFDELINKSNLLQELLASSNGIDLNKMGSNSHVHGEMNGGHACMGVNDESQIENEVIRKDARTRIFIKPKYLDILQNKNVNHNIPRSVALKAINESSVICSFGVSIGDSDKFWWEEIGKWPKKSGGVLVIFDKCDISDDGNSPLELLNSDTSIQNRKQDIIERFTRLSNIDSEWLNKNPDKILVELNSDLFSLILPKKESFKGDILTINVPGLTVGAPRNKK